jgi:hypothetical protein
MQFFVGIDVSLASSSICVIDERVAAAGADLALRLDHHPLMRQVIEVLVMQSDALPARRPDPTEPMTPANMREHGCGGRPLDSGRKNR